jgi:hypothetical protein
MTQLQKKQDTVLDFNRLSISDKKWIYTNYNLKRKYNIRQVDFDMMSRYKRDRVYV